MRLLNFSIKDINVLKTAKRLKFEWETRIPFHKFLPFLMTNLGKILELHNYIYSYVKALIQWAKLYFNDENFLLTNDVKSSYHYLNQHYYYSKETEEIKKIQYKNLEVIIVMWTIWKILIILKNI